MYVIAASCACGRVKFECEDPPLLQFVCHCADCRNASKKDFTTTAIFLASSTEQSGELSEREYTAASGGRTTRGFCRHCSSLMFDKSERFPTLIGVMVENIDAPFEAEPSWEPSCHVWVGSKLPHVSLADDLPQHVGELA